ncbi:MAG: type II toxin-antitoxin system Phd/YefM family antitoxin [Alphaproteobacteria bacterium]
MLHVPASEVQKQFGHYQDKALLEPVFVTRNGRERTVLLSTEEYYRLKRASLTAGAGAEDATLSHAASRKLDVLEKLTSTAVPTVSPLADEAISRENLYRFEVGSQ